MEHQEKIKKWIAFAKAKGLSDGIARPLIDRVISAIGLQVPPFIFWKFSAVAVLGGVQFGIFYGIFMYLTVWSERPVLHTVVASVAVGIPFGICAAAFQAWYKRRWKLPPWDTFSSSTD